MERIKKYFGNKLKCCGEKNIEKSAFSCRLKDA